MKLRDAIVSAKTDGTLLRTIAEKWYDQHEGLLEPVVALHNSGQIDIVRACASKEINDVPSKDLFGLQRVFYQALPDLECNVEDAVSACRALYDQVRADGTAGYIYEGLRKWLEKDEQRVEQSLAEMEGKNDICGNVTRCSLLAGASFDLAKYSRLAMQISRRSKPETRRAAIVAIGYMPLKENDQNLDDVLGRLHELLKAPKADEDCGYAIEAASNILGRVGETLLDRVEPLLYSACDRRNPISRQAIAHALLSNGKLYTENMVTATFEALKETRGSEAATIHLIDSVLCEWDLENERERILDLLTALIGRDADGLDYGDLPSFLHKVEQGAGDILGWFVVCLLFTGNHRLSEFANRMLPFREVQDGLDIDVGSLAQDSRWILFLAKKILGYCLINRDSTGMFLAACLRAVAEQERSELEDLIFEYYLVNYPKAIKILQSTVSEGEPARSCVGRLEERISAYLDALGKPGSCSAFDPSERERWLRVHRNIDFWREAQEKAERQSVFYQVAHKSLLLYGTRSIVYAYAGEGQERIRQEVALGSHEFKAEFPRLEVIDPVGHQWALTSFRLELTPS